MNNRISACPAPLERDGTFRFEESVRIAVIVPDVQTRTALARLLSADGELEIVDQLASVDRRRLTDARPDLIVVDVDPWVGNAKVRRSSRSSPEAASAVPTARVCALSVHVDPKLARRVMLAQAVAYIVKDTSAERLCEIVNGCAQGECYTDPRIAGTLLRGNRRGGQVHPELSARETEIVVLIAEGLSNREIGQRLNLSEKTVKNHVSRIFVKLHVSARSHAAVYAIRNGLA